MLNKKKKIKNKKKMLMDLITHLNRPLLMVGAGFVAGMIATMYFLKNCYFAGSHLLVSKEN